MNYVAVLLVGIVLGAAAMYFIKPPVMREPATVTWMVAPAPGAAAGPAAWKINTSTGQVELCQMNSANKLACSKATEG